jgi:hypothetical protein
LAGRAIDAALDPSADSLRAGSLALSIIKEAEPASSGHIELSTEITAESVDNLGLSELLVMAGRLGLTPASDGVTSIEASPSDP